jgi:hypothetical protein
MLILAGCIAAAFSRFRGKTGVTALASLRIM